MGWAATRGVNGLPFGWIPTLSCLTLGLGTTERRLFWGPLGVCNWEATIINMFFLPFKWVHLGPAICSYAPVYTGNRLIGDLFVCWWIKEPVKLSVVFFFFFFNKVVQTFKKLAFLFLKKQIKIFI